MQRLSQETSQDKRTLNILNGMKQNFGMIPNIFKIVGNSPNTLEGFCAFKNALDHGVLSDKEREQISLALAGYDKSQYCASAHCALGQKAGISQEEMKQNLMGQSSVPKISALMQFCLAILKNKGNVSDAELNAVRSAGYSDEAIIEVVGLIAINVFTNYFNNLASTDVDFPQVALTKTE